MLSNNDNEMGPEIFDNSTMFISNKIGGETSTFARRRRLRCGISMFQKASEIVSVHSF